MAAKGGLEGETIPKKALTSEAVEEGAKRIARLIQGATVDLESWTVRAASGSFSKVFKMAVETHTPQRVAHRDGGSVFILAEDDLRALAGMLSGEVPMADCFTLMGGAGEVLDPLPRQPSRGIGKL